ncbi:tripartite-type tricarboxylate transporter receptor subunit TctC [Ancylobacter sp. 3268]|uniref:tripartite tricarboxylate transporter substrate binding protein n=1 Tax=Ancylobacter sp. 3268 TaxID=2817752 RepID=UPI002861BE95|nr:tripartite tricarboxylate transporter substrate binding protein [Ancylobacter sp. 3268]MDR6953246.1 tripartite-type tricarboxylate transporter receptor subunit TctC [Ancylobacter sp. 3268]
MIAVACMRMYRRLAAAALVSVACAASAPARAEWPERPVTLIVIAGAGGGSDFTMRLLARELEANLKQPFTVVNQPQASGVVGMTNYTRAAPDGYTLGQLSPFAQYRLAGQASFTPASFTPIAQFNADPAAIHVAQDSPLKTVNDVIGQLRKDPASLKISCGGTCNASWDIPFLSLLMDQGVEVAKVNLIPAQGSAAGLQELASGGVDIVLCSLPETDALASAGKVRSIGVMSDARLERYPNVATVAEQTGKAYTGGTWRAIAGPAGIDPALAVTIEAAIRKAFDSETFQKGMKERGFGAVWRGREDLAAFLVEHDTMTTEVMQAVAAKN